MFISNKVRSLTFAASVIGLILVSSFSILNPSSDNQAFATIENNKISDSIKKACPTYQDNGNINGLVSNVLKACVNRGGVSEPSPGPNDPPWIPVPQNVIILEKERNSNYDITISILHSAARTTSQFDIDYFTMPVGLTYKIEANDPADPNEEFTFRNGIGQDVDCIELDRNSCTLEMGTTVQYIRITPA